MSPAVPRETEDQPAREVSSYDAASSAARTSYGQNLRGRPPLVPLDGVSLDSARGLYRQFDAIDPFNIERVEILSGATSLYGGNATGGIINIITQKGRDAKPGLGGEALVGAESGFRGRRDGDGKLAGAVTSKDETWDARLSIAGNKTRAFYDGSGTILVPDITRSNTAFNEKLDLFGTVGLQIDDTRRAEISAQHHQSEQDSEYGLYSARPSPPCATPSASRRGAASSATSGRRAMHCAASIGMRLGSGLARQPPKIRSKTPSHDPRRKRWWNVRDRRSPTGASIPCNPLRRTETTPLPVRRSPAHAAFDDGRTGEVRCKRRSFRRRRSTDRPFVWKTI